MTQEPEEFEAGLNIKRGLKMAVIFAVIGFLGKVIVEFVFTPLIRPDLFQYSRTYAGHYAYSFGRLIYCLTEKWLNMRESMPVIGIVMVFACTAWATYAPKGNYKFASTLIKFFWLCILVVIIRGMTIMGWFYHDHWLYWKPFIISQLFIILPLVAYSIFLSLSRAKKQEPEQKNP